MSSSIAAFEKFYCQWLNDMKARLRDLRTIVNEQTSRSQHLAGDPGDAAMAESEAQQHVWEMVRDVHARCIDYMDEKRKLCREDASFVLAGMWRSHLEASFNWMGGWRPTAAIVLVYSLMGMHIEDELLRLIHGIELPTMGSLSATQLSNLDALQQKLRIAEDSLCTRIAVVQMLVADHHMTKVAATSDPPISESNDFSVVQDAIEPKLANLSDLLLEAEDLRGATLQGLLDILNPLQAGQYVVAAFEMAIAIQTLGNQRGDSINAWNVPAYTNGIKITELASQGDHISLQKALDGYMVDPSEPDYDGRTPLHLAATNGYVECISLLIEKGADVNKKDKFGVTPLLEAIRAGHDSVMQILVECGAKAHLEDEGTELCKAAASRDISYMERLIKHGVSPNVSDYGDRTPLHIAAAEGDLELATLLVNHGANVLAKDRHGFTPLDAARMSCDRAMIQLLERKVSNGNLIADDMESELDVDTTTMG